MHVVMIFQGLQELGGLRSFFFIQFWNIFWEIAKFACNNGPPIGGQPLGYSMEVRPFSDKAGARYVFRDVVILLMGKWINILGASFNRSRFDVRRRIRM